MTPWSCYRCLKTSGRFHSRALLCRTCRDAVRASGLEWCNACKNTIDPWSFSYINCVCLACHAARQRELKARNPAVAERHRERARAWRRQNTQPRRFEPWQKYADRANARRRERYATDSAYREKRRALERAWRKRKKEERG